MQNNTSAYTGKQKQVLDIIAGHNSLNQSHTSHTSRKSVFLGLRLNIGKSMMTPSIEVSPSISQFHPAVGLKGTGLGAKHLQLFRGCCKPPANQIKSGNHLDREIATSVKPVQDDVWCSTPFNSEHLDTRK